MFNDKLSSTDILGLVGMGLAFVAVVCLLATIFGVETIRAHHATERARIKCVQSVESGSD
jgi:hypothetical protein